MVLVTKLCKGCPTIVAVGPAETGKCTALNIAAAVTGIPFRTIIMSRQVNICGGSEKYERGSNSFYLERCSLSSLPYVIDDPPKSASSSSINDFSAHLRS